MHHLTAELYVLENEPGAGRQQLLRTHRPPFGWPGDPPGRGGLPETGDDLQGGCQDLAQNNQRQPARNVCQSQVHVAAGAGIDQSCHRPSESNEGAAYREERRSPPEPDYQRERR